jgi:hypothetical protein
MWMLIKMIDWIISGTTGAIYAQVDLLKDDGANYFYSGKIIQNNMPDKLTSLINEYDELVAGCSLSLLDAIEEDIYKYDLRLKLLNTKVFNLVIKEGEKINFFTKYPTSQGFLDSYPI